MGMVKTKLPMVHVYTRNNKYAKYLHSVGLPWFLVPLRTPYWVRYDMKPFRCASLSLPTRLRFIPSIPRAWDRVSRPDWNRSGLPRGWKQLSGGQFAIIIISCVEAGSTAIKGFPLPKPLFFVGAMCNGVFSYSRRVVSVCTSG